MLYQVIFMTQNSKKPVLIFASTDFRDLDDIREMQK